MDDANVHGTQLTAKDRSVRPTESAGDDNLLAPAVLGRDETSIVENVSRLPGDNIPVGPVNISKSLAIRLYTSHFLSTWNARLFEAAAVYFLASIFPDNLLPISVYALTRNAAAIALTVPVGKWIDRANRLTIVRSSIVGQRVAVAASCGLFWVMLAQPLSTAALDGLFAAAVILACVEKIAAGANLVSVERDWVVVITEGNEPARRMMNARMRRIDLFCKLLGPLAIALIAAASVPAALYSTLGTNVASVLVEYLCIETVFRRVPTLRRCARPSTPQPPEAATHQEEQSRRQSPYTAFRQRLRRMASQIPMIPSLRLYFGHPAFIPSFSLSLLYLTVLSFSGQMLTYLLASNINLWQVGIIRGVSTLFELSATWIAPRLTKRIGVIRTGLWSISWQMIWLTGGVTWFFYHYGRGYPLTDIMPAAGLAVAVAFSRIGLWGFDLSAQNIVQDEVQGDRRGIFSTIETSFQNVFDMLAWALTIIWPKPASFQWPVLISFAAVYIAGGLYASFLRRRRGHFLHAPSCLGPKADV
ncbi:Ferroporti-1 [Thermothelomyces heterothallicus CBS 202.75]|uniref:Ferroporti-1 n=1 Tax=Thermothelomyces heterothallicus CBS 202.75 TaxID=1149848 RepID=UPI003742818F